MHGQKVVWVGRVGLELLPKTKDMVIDRASGRIIGVSPDFVQQFFSWNDSARRACEKLEQFEFLSREYNGFARAHRLHAGKVDSDITEGQQFMSRCVSCDRCAMRDI